VWLYLVDASKILVCIYRYRYIDEYLYLHIDIYLSVYLFTEIHVDRGFSIWPSLQLYSHQPGIYIYLPIDSYLYICTPLLLALGRHTCIHIYTYKYNIQIHTSICICISISTHPTFTGLHKVYIQMYTYT